MYMFMYINIYIYTCIYLHIYVYAYLHIYLCIHVYTYTHTYICVYIYIICIRAVELTSVAFRKRDQTRIAYCHTSFSIYLY